MEPPNLREYEFILKLKEAVSDLDLTEYQNSFPQLLRWLRARDMDLIKSEEMLRKSVEWRKGKDVDNILSWTPPGWMVAEFPYQITGFNARNSTIYFAPNGRYDLKKVARLGKGPEYCKYVIQMLEKLLAANRDKINPVNDYSASQIVYVSDMANFPYSQLMSIDAVNIMLESMREFESNYPEILEMCIVINAPFIFSILFNLIKPIMGQRTMDKVKVFSSNGREFLLKNLGAENVPEKYGGSFIETL